MGEEGPSKEKVIPLFPRIIDRDGTRYENIGDLPGHEGHPANREKPPAPEYPIEHLPPTPIKPPQGK